MQSILDCDHGGFGFMLLFDCKQKRAHPIDMPVENTVLRKVLLTDGRLLFRRLIQKESTLRWAETRLRLIIQLLGFRHLDQI